MTLDEQLNKEVEQKEESKHNDVWAKNKLDSLLHKLGKGLVYATVGAVATFGVAYTTGAQWAKEIRAYLDADYGIKLKNETKIVNRDYSSPEFSGLGLASQNFDLDCKLAAYWHLVDNNPQNVSTEDSAHYAFVMTEIFATWMVSENVRDVKGELIKDPEFFTDLMMLTIANPNKDVKVIEIYSFLSRTLEENTWEQTAKILEQKYKR